ncbi:MAG TPA: sodium:calcium antiporter, partial [Proteobacteria bacterium]|nr:sodium:calcium antiporter [Pseudomonadota bacterium]
MMDIASVAAFILGLALLWTGAELLVHFGVKLAVRLGISSALVGLIVIAYGTSLPELVVGVIAAVQKRGLIVYGDVVGTNIVNLSFVLGLAAIVGVVTVKREIARFQLPFLAAITALLIMLSMDGVLSRLDALAFLVAMGLYLYLTIRSEAQSELEGDIAISGGASLPLLVISIAAGFVILILGARLMVDSAVLIARALGVSDRVIALTIVAAGTSLPEAATAIVAAVRRQAALGLGGLVGSNIFNTLLILG